jgi:hypothetical protein
MIKVQSVRKEMEKYRRPELRLKKLAILCCLILSGL